jgi:hypothetical protein
MMDSGIARVIECFPEHAAAVRDRFQDDEGFREMCRDYADALDALRRWQASDSPQKAARVEEYRELARALEVEIATALALPPPNTEERPR